MVDIFDHMKFLLYRAQLLKVDNQFKIHQMNVEPVFVVRELWHVMCCHVNQLDVSIQHRVNAALSVTTATTMVKS